MCCFPPAFLRPEVDFLLVVRVGHEVRQRADRLVLSPAPVVILLAFADFSTSFCGIPVAATATAGGSGTTLLSGP